MWRKTFQLAKTTHLSSGDKCCHLTLCFRLMEPNYVEPLPGKARCFEFRSVDSTSRTEVDYPLVDGLTIEATFIKDSSVWSDHSFVNKWCLSREILLLIMYQLFSSFWKHINNIYSQNTYLCSSVLTRAVHFLPILCIVSLVNPKLLSQASIFSL